MLLGARPEEPSRSPKRAASEPLFADELERQGVARSSASTGARRRRAGDARAPCPRRRGDRARQRRGGGAARRAQPLLVGVGVARDLLPGVSARTLLHAGPPIEWADMSGPLRGAIVGAAVHEGLADDHEEAERTGRRRRVRVRPVPRARRGRPDGRRRQPLDADVHRRERHARQPRVLHVQRGARQGAALRRQRRRGARPPGAGSATCSRACSRGRSSGSAAGRPAGDDRPGAADGRRGPQPQPRRHVAAAARAAAGADRARRAVRRRRRRRALHRRQRPLLPEPDDAGLARRRPTPRRASSAPRSSRRWPATAPSSASA